MIDDPRRPLSAGEVAAIVALLVFAIVLWNYLTGDDEAERAADAACAQDLQCWGDRHRVTASLHCEPHVERLAAYSHEWTDRWSRLSRFRWGAERPALTYIGDQIKFQNGFGAWQHHVYECDYDPATETVIAVRAQPGRLPIRP